MANGADAVRNVGDLAQPVIFQASAGESAAGNSANGAGILYRVPRLPIVLSGSERILGGGIVPIALLASMVALFAYFRILHPVAPELTLTVLLAIYVAATLSSVAGFAFSAICGAILFHLLDHPVHIVQTMIVCSIAIQIFSVVSLRNAIDWTYLRRFLAGGVVGLPLGIYCLIHISPRLYMIVMGIFLVAYGLYMLMRRLAVLDNNLPAADYAAGVLGGITGGFAGFPGAFVTIWCGLKGWTKNQQRGVYQPFILIMQVMALITLTFMQASKSTSSGIDLMTIAYIPAAVLGTWCGIAIFRRLTDLQFARWVNILIVVSGFGLIF